MVHMERTYLEFEKPVAELEGKIAELAAVAAESNEGAEITEELDRLTQKARKQLETIYGKLDPWQKTLVARHPDRPHMSDIVAELFDEFTELGGDRNFGDDPAIMGGMARFGGRPVVVFGHEKGADTASRIERNFGMANPEGYRKCIRLMELAERYNMPVLAFADTPGAYPGVSAEERGQGEAIARSIEKCLTVKVPIVTSIVGEGNSGGAVAIAASNIVLMLEHAIYSVITPEGAASILFGTAAKAREMASSLKITAQDMLRLGVIDTIIPEPVGGAHREKRTALQRLGVAIGEALKELDALDGDALIQHRREKFLQIGRALETSPVPR